MAHVSMIKSDRYDAADYNVHAQNFCSHDTKVCWGKFGEYDKWPAICWKIFLLKPFLLVLIVKVEWMFDLLTFFLPEFSEIEGEQRQSFYELSYTILVPYKFDHYVEIVKE